MGCGSSVLPEAEQTEKQQTNNPGEISLVIKGPESSFTHKAKPDGTLSELKEEIAIECGVTNFAMRRRSLQEKCVAHLELYFSGYRLDPPESKTVRQCTELCTVSQSLGLIL